MCPVYTQCCTQRLCSGHTCSVSPDRAGWPWVERALCMHGLHRTLDAGPSHGGEGGSGGVGTHRITSLHSPHLLGARGATSPTVCNLGPWAKLVPRPHGCAHMHDAAKHHSSGSDVSVYMSPKPRITCMQKPLCDARCTGAAGIQAVNVEEFNACVENLCCSRVQAGCNVLPAFHGRARGERFPMCAQWHPPPPACTQLQSVVIIHLPAAAAACAPSFLASSGRSRVHVLYRRELRVLPEAPHCMATGYVVQIMQVGYSHACGGTF